MDEEESIHYKRWKEAYGDMSEEERNILEREMRDLGMSDLAER